MGVRHHGIRTILQDAIGAHPERGAIKRLADHLGVTTSTVSRWHTGNSTPDARHWPELERYLNMPQGTFEAAAVPPDGETIGTVLERLAEVSRAMKANDQRAHDDRVVLAERLEAMQRELHALTMAVMSVAAPDGLRPVPASDQ